MVKRIAPFVVSFAVASASVPAASAAAPSSSAGPEVVEPIDLEGSIPGLWEPVAAVGGCLDGDDLGESVVVLHRHKTIPGDRELPVGSRALAIFSLQSSGRWRREALAEGILPCVKCLGTLNRDARGIPFEVEIDADRRLHVSWISNADGLLSVHLVVAWDPGRGAYGLVADEVALLDSVTGERSLRRRDYTRGAEILNGAERPMEPRFVPVEEVTAADYP